MKLLRNTAVVLSAASVASVAIAGTAAGASVHKGPGPFPSDRLVVNAAIGGLTLNESPSKAKRTFPKKDCTAGGCSYTAHGYNVYFVVAKRSTHGKPFLGQVALTASTLKHNPATAITTSKGIGLGSTVKAFRKAYPHTAGSGQSYQIAGKGETETDFYFEKSRLVDIEMSNVRVG